jgi:hypothetical protein
LTNHPFYSERNGQGISNVLEVVKNAASVADLPPGVARWVRLVARDAGVIEDAAFAALSKTMAEAGLPKLRDAVVRLINTIVECWPPAADSSVDAVRRAAQALIDECGRASSLDHEQLLPAYLISAVDGDAARAARIAGKRMTITRVRAILESGRDSNALLVGDPAYRPEPGAGSTDLLQKKLDAGGFSMVSINSAEDLRNKADYLGISWTKKYGRDTGLQRYEHVRTLVLSDAGRAFDATQTLGDGFGPAMRDDLRRRFRNRRAAGEALFGSTDDHLEGIAFSLTAQCMVVWSSAKPWESI